MLSPRNSMTPAPPTHDTDLLRRLRSSDRGALGDLFDRYQPMLFRQLCFQTGDPQLAHDIVQETFLRIWDHRASLKPDLSFPAYMLRISRNILVDSLRHRQTRVRHTGKVSAPSLSEGDDPEESAQLSQLEQALADVIHKDLPERTRTVFILSRFEGKNNAEIAALLGTSVRTVENQIQHALKVLRLKLKDFLTEES